MLKTESADSTELNNFIASVERIVAVEKDQRRIVEEIEPLLQELIRGDLLWLKSGYRTPPANKTGVASGYGQYCLYRRGNELSVIVFCWGPGKGTPVHDHLSWGVLGFIDGCEKETRYRRIDDGTNPNYAELKEVGIFSTKQGDTSHILTPARDIHKVENPGNQPSVSIHVYGCNMGSQRRRRYDLNTGKIEWYVTEHDSDEVVII